MRWQGVYCAFTWSVCLRSELRHMLILQFLSSLFSVWRYQNVLYSQFTAVYFSRMWAGWKHSVAVWLIKVAFERAASNGWIMINKEVTSFLLIMNVITRSTFMQTKAEALSIYIIYHKGKLHSFCGFICDIKTRMAVMLWSCLRPIFEHTDNASRFLSRKPPRRMLKKNQNKTKP